MSSSRFSIKKSSSRSVSSAVGLKHSSSSVKSKPAAVDVAELACYLTDLAESEMNIATLKKHPLFKYLDRQTQMDIITQIEETQSQKTHTAIHTQNSTKEEEVEKEEEAAEAYSESDVPEDRLKQLQHLSSKYILYQGDITRLRVDAIVNAANNSLEAGGGICGAIFTAAGYHALAKACDTFGFCETGENVMTPAFKLPCKYIIHSVGPMDGDADALIACYRNILETCKQHALKSVAICCIATGIFGFDNFHAAEIAIRTTKQWFEEKAENMNAVDSVVFCTFTDKDTEIYESLLPLFFTTYPQLQQEQETEASQIAESKVSEVTESAEPQDDQSHDEQDGKIEQDIKILEQLVDQIDFEDHSDIHDTPTLSSSNSHKPSEITEEKVIEQSQPVEVITVVPYTTK